MPTTTNFGWTTPADTDLVKDGASAMRTLANGIDTSLAQLKGGTTGQILSKTSNTDMAFTWINNDQGDITAVTAGTGLSGGGTAGAVTLAIDTGTTVDLSTAQTLSNKTISGSTNTLSNIALSTATTGTLAETRGGTNQTTYTTGDLLYASASNTLAKRSIGTTGQVLTVSGGVPTWAAPAGGGKVLQVVSATYSTATTASGNTMVDTGVSASITPSSTSSKILVMTVIPYALYRSNSPDQWMNYKLLRNSTTIIDNSGSVIGIYLQTPVKFQYVMTYLDSPASTSSLTYKSQMGGDASQTTVTFQPNSSQTSTLVLMEIGA